MRFPLCWIAYISKSSCLIPPIHGEPAGIPGGPPVIFRSCRLVWVFLSGCFVNRYLKFGGFYQFLDYLGLFLPVSILFCVGCWLDC